MDLFTIPNGYTRAQARKLMSELKRGAREASKRETCILCGCSTTSFCNSHSVPSMVLQNIAQNGKVLYANSLIGVEVLDEEKGVNNSGTFHIICKECDSKFFQDYENPDNIKLYPNDIILAEIALKNTLIQLSKRLQERELYAATQERTHAFEDMEYLDEIHRLDIRDYTEEIEYYKNIMQNKISGGFQILYWKLLPYRTPIAVQTGIALSEDMCGNRINDLFDMSEAVRIENMHICVFPLVKETVVLAFYHKRDRKYRALRHQFNSVSDSEKLSYLNWLVFKYTENYYISKSQINTLNSNPKIKELSRESNDSPNLGAVDWYTMINGYTTVKADEIPNFLSPAFADQD